MPGVPLHLSAAGFCVLLAGCGYSGSSYSSGSQPSATKTAITTPAS
jgi:hypothetical protein